MQLLFQSYKKQKTQSNELTEFLFLTQNKMETFVLTLGADSRVQQQSILL